MFESEFKLINLSVLSLLQFPRLYFGQTFLRFVSAWRNSKDFLWWPLCHQILHQSFTWWELMRTLFLNFYNIVNISRPRFRRWKCADVWGKLLRIFISPFFKSSCLQNKCMLLPFDISCKISPRSRGLRSFLKRIRSILQK